MMPMTSRRTIQPSLWSAATSAAGPADRRKPIILETQASLGIAEHRYTRPIVRPLPERVPAGTFDFTW